MSVMDRWLGVEVVAMEFLVVARLFLSVLGGSLMLFVVAMVF